MVIEKRDDKEHLQGDKSLLPENMPIAKKIPKVLKWSPEMSVEEPVIDSQHKEIIEQIRILESKLEIENALPVVREGIHFLDTYIKNHFTYEEDYMKRIRYPELKKHQAVHRQFIEFYKEFKRRLMLDLTKVKDVRTMTQNYMKEIHKFLGGWIVKHTLGEDQGYHEYAKKKGLIKK